MRFGFVGLVLAAAVLRTGAEVLTVTGEMTVSGAEAVEALGEYSAVKLEGSGSRIVFELGEGEDAGVDIPVNGAGAIVKRGAGTLRLNDASAANNYMADERIIIEAGMVVLPQNATENNQRNSYVKVKIAEGARLAVGARSDGWFITSVDFAESYGEVTNVNDSANVINVGVEASGIFSGTFCRGAKNNQCGMTLRTGRGGFEMRGVNRCGGNELVMHGGTFGFRDGASLGEAYQIRDGNDGWAAATVLKYLGEGGDKVEKRFLFNGNYSNFPGKMSWVDGGEHGGLIFWPSACDWGSEVTQMGFRGEGEKVCVLGGRWSEGENQSVTLVKDGGGTWRLVHEPLRQMKGAVEVRKGTLQFETMHEKGALSAMGYATMCMQGYKGAYDETRVADYAILLGDGEGAGTLEHVGLTNIVNGLERPIAVNGAGARIRDMGRGKAVFCGAFAKGGERTLALDGTNLWSELRGAGDGEGGVLSIEKEGSGTWTLTGDQAFSGGLRVKEGKVKVRRRGANPKYTWYRFAITEMLCSAKVRLGIYEALPVNCAWNLAVQRLGFFDANGTRQGAGAMAFEAGGAAALDPGECAYWRNAHLYNLHEAQTGDGGCPHYMFLSHNNWCPYSRRRTDWVRPAPGKPETWHDIVIRMPEDGPEIVAYDVLKYGMNSDRDAASWRLYGSADGVEWDLLDEVVYEDGCDRRENAAQWYYSLNTYAQPGNNVGGKAIPARREGGGDSGQLASAGEIEVMAGAELEAEGDVELKRLTVDAAGGVGVVRGFRFAGEGELRLRNMPEGGAGRVEVEAEIAGGEGVENLAGWRVVNEGVGLWKARYKGGKFVMSKFGMMILVK